MSFSLNICILKGKLGHDAKSGVSKNGVKWATCSVATEDYNPKTKQSTTDWHNVVAFGYCADVVSMLKKGDSVAIEGKYKNKEYEDKEGKKVKTFQIQASSVFKVTEIDRLAQENKPEAESYFDQGVQEGFTY